MLLPDSQSSLTLLLSSEVKFYQNSHLSSFFFRKEDLRGKKIVFTGALSSCTRKEASSEAERLGCTVMSGVSKNVDIVVVGENAGQKLDKAKSLGKMLLYPLYFVSSIFALRRGVYNISHSSF